MRAYRIVFLAVVGGFVLLTIFGCASAPAGIGCSKLTAWSTQDQTALKTVYDAEPDGSIVRKAIDDLEYMRDQARACTGRK